MDDQEKEAMPTFIGENMDSTEKPVKGDAQDQKDQEETIESKVDDDNNVLELVLTI